MLMRLMSKGEYLIVPKGTKFTGSGKLGLKQGLGGWALKIARSTTCPLNFMQACYGSGSCYCPQYHLPSEFYASMLWEWQLLLPAVPPALWILCKHAMGVAVATARSTTCPLNFMQACYGSGSCYCPQYHLPSEFYASMLWEWQLLLPAVPPALWILCKHAMGVAVATARSTTYPLNFMQACYGSGSCYCPQYHLPSEFYASMLWEWQLLLPAVPPALWILCKHAMGVAVATARSTTCPLNFMQACYGSGSCYCPQYHLPSEFYASMLWEWQLLLPAVPPALWILCKHAMGVAVATARSTTCPLNFMQACYGSGSCYCPQYHLPSEFYASMLWEWQLLLPAVPPALWILCKHAMGVAVATARSTTCPLNFMQACYGSGSCYCPQYHLPSEFYASMLWEWQLLLPAVPPALWILCKHAMGVAVATARSTTCPLNFMQACYGSGSCYCPQYHLPSEFYASMLWEWQLLLPAVPPALWILCKHAMGVAVATARSTTCPLNFMQACYGSGSCTLSPKPFLNSKMAMAWIVYNI